MRTIEEIGQLIKTQDNRITDQPMFLVERKRTDWGFDGAYVEDYKWVNHDNEGEVAEEEKEEELEELESNCESTGDWEKSYYVERWEFVTACFTEKGCEDYILRNGHNLGETRIYVDGSYRNVEWQTVRNMLIDKAEKASE